MPQLGETVAEGKITKWFKSAGDAVKPGDNLFEIETDKMSMEVPSTTAGMLAEIRVPAGEVAPVGAVVAVIADGAGAAASAASGQPPLRASGIRAQPTRPRQRAAEPRRRGYAMPARASRQRRSRSTRSSRCARPSATTARHGLPGGTARHAAGAPARRRARHRSRRASRGSGPHGRIVARDVETRGARRAPRRAIAAGASAAQVKALYRDVAVRGGAARRHAPHHRHAAGRGQADHSAFLSDRRCRRSDALIALREEANAAAPKDRTASRPSSFRSTISSSRPGRRRCSACRPPTRSGRSDRILRFTHSDIGVAVAIDGGLITPVIRNADSKIAVARSRPRCRIWPTRAREKKLKPDEYQGGVERHLQSRHVRRARILRHHQSAARDHPGGRRDAARSRSRADDGSVAFVSR